MPNPNDLRRAGQMPARPSVTSPLAKGGSPHGTDLSAVFQTLKKVGFDLVFLLDVSGSMHGEPRREMIAGVRAAVRKLLAKEAKITIIVFSDDAETILDRSQSDDSIGAALDRLPSGVATVMERGFLEARRALRDSERAIIHLVTDGMPNDQDATLVQARLCQEAGITVRCTGTTGADLGFLKLLAGGEETSRAELVAPGELRRAIESTAVAALPSPGRTPS